MNFGQRQNRSAQCAVGHRCGIGDQRQTGGCQRREAQGVPLSQLVYAIVLTRDHLWDPTKNQIAVVYLPPSAVTKEMLRLPDIIGRVLNHEKTPGYVFTDGDFMPPGTREGFIAGVPADFHGPSLL